jgi:hypothetical protein
VENPCRETARRGVKNQRQMVMIQFEPRMDTIGFQRTERQETLPASFHSCLFVSIRGFRPFAAAPRRMQPVFTAIPARFLNRRRTRTRTAEGFLKTH